MQIKKVFRQERKFLISGEQYYRFSRQFAELFKEDSHNGKDGYMVRSLYFDTLGNKDFEEKLAGVECRRKMRLRIYSPQSRTALLEMKQKQGSNQLKRSLTISREHAEELMKGHYEVLLEYSDPFATECYGVLKTNCYIPKVIVEYKRMVYRKWGFCGYKFILDHHVIFCFMAADAATSAGLSTLCCVAGL